MDKEFQENYDQYHSIVEQQLNSTVQLNYQQNFEQMRFVLTNGRQTIERAILELKHLCDIWSEYDQLNRIFVNWLNQTENQLTNFLTQHDLDDEQIINELARLNDSIRDHDKQLQTLEELEHSIGDYDWTRQAHNSSILRQR